MKTDIQRQLFEKNLRLFKEKYEPVHDAMQDLTPTRVSFDAQTILYEGKPLYPTEMHDECARQVEKFLKNPELLYFFPPPLKYEDRFSSDLGQSTAHTVNTIANRSPLRQGRFRTYFYDGHFFPVMVIFGVGSGLHIQKLSQTATIQRLIVWEPDLELFHASLHFTDWIEVVKHIPDLRILLGRGGDTPFDLTPLLHTGFSFAHSALPWFTHYTIPESDAIREATTQKAIHSRNWNMYELSRCTLENVLFHAIQGSPIYHGPSASAPLLSSEATVILVGAGPSLDRTWPRLRKKAQTALVISCGTALVSLLHEGIVPDLHMEVEEGPWMDGIIQSHGYEEILRTIPLIALPGLPETVRKRFASTWVYCKQNNATSEMFLPGQRHLPNCYPTVVNSALSLVLDAGFQTILLFGVDMGFSSPGKRHARHYPDFKAKKAHLASFLHLRDEDSEEPVLGMLPGNLNKKKSFFVTNTFQWAREIMEQSLRFHPHAKVFNFSDGVRIKGTVSGSPSSAPNAPSKSEQRALLTRCFVRSTPDVQAIRDRLPRLTNEICRVLKRMVARLDEPIASRRMLATTLLDIHRMLDTLHRRQASEGYVLLHGSLNHIGFVLYSHAAALEDADEFLSFVREAQTQFQQYLQWLEKDWSTLTTRLMQQIQPDYEEPFGGYGQLIDPSQQNFLQIILGTLFNKDSDGIDTTDGIATSQAHSSDDRGGDGDGMVQRIWQGLRRTRRGAGGT